jgi:hypothetical protein
MDEWIVKETCNRFICQMEGKKKRKTYPMNHPNCKVWIRFRARTFNGCSRAGGGFGGDIVLYFLIYFFKSFFLSFVRLGGL